MSRSGVMMPALLRTAPLERPENQRLETDLLFPVAFSQSSTKFVFDRKGILDSNSQIKFRVTCKRTDGNPFDNDDGQICYFPTATGAAAAIQNAYLEIGGRRVATLQDVGHYTTWKRLHWSNEFRDGIAQPKQGGEDVFLGSQSRAYPPAAPFGTIGRFSNGYAQNVTASDSFTKKKYRLEASAEDTFEAALSLSQLIPMLKGVLLPLFAIKQEVSLTIEWSEDKVGTRFCKSKTLSPIAGDIAVTSAIDQPSCLIMADYLYYPDQLEALGDDIMSRGGYDLVYEELQVAYNAENSAGNRAAGSTLQTETFLPLGGKRVKAVIQQSQFNGATGNVNSYLNNVGIYNSKALVNGESMNLTIDANPFYAIPLKNPALQFKEANAVEGIPLQLNAMLYDFTPSLDGNGANYIQGITDRHYNGFNQDALLIASAAAPAFDLGLAGDAGAMHWTGVKISNAAGNGVRMSNTPMIWTRTSTISAPGGMGLDDAVVKWILRYFVVTERVLNISNGIVNMIE
tara:strand:+ start:12294 stop:13835 length:1542 start_codon:yes stop_codon:yes gene_type:complete